MISYLVVRNCDSKETLGHRQQVNRYQLQSPLKSYVQLLGYHYMFFHKKCSYSKNFLVMVLVVNYFVEGLID